MGYLLARDISDFSPRVIPATTLRTEMKELSLTPPIRFALDIAKEQTNIEEFDVEEEVRMEKAQFYDAFAQWCTAHGERYNSNEKSFFVAMKNVGIDARKVRFGKVTKMGVLFTLQTLRDAIRIHLYTALE